MGIFTIVMLFALICAMGFQIDHLEYELSDARSNCFDRQECHELFLDDEGVIMVEEGEEREFCEMVGGW